MMRVEENKAAVYEKSSHSRTIKEAMPELRDIQIRVDSVALSREGQAALRGQGQGTFWQIDLDEILQMREIWPKLSMDLSYEMMRDMQTDMRKTSEETIKSKGYESLDDRITKQMNAYARQYEALQRGHADGTRDVYVSDGWDENGKEQYHKVTLEEDLKYLDEAFGRIADDMVLATSSQENLRQSKEYFSGQKLTAPLPGGSGQRLADTLKRAASAYAQQRQKGNPANAARMALNALDEDRSFSNTMRKLFSVR